MVFESIFSFVSWTLSGFVSGIIVYYVHDFFYVPKKELDKEPCTDAENVKKLYKSIKLIEKTKRKISNEQFLFILYCMYQTFISVAKFKYTIFLSKRYSPEKLGKHFIAVPYYMNNIWYKAVLPHHIKKVPKITKVMSIDSKGFSKDITKSIKEYLGPNEDFNHQFISPRDLGFNELEFSIFSTTGYVLKHNFKESEIIRLH